MTTDPFEKFERSRGGLSIPLAVFIFGGLLTYLAVSSLHGIAIRHDEANRSLEERRANGVAAAEMKATQDAGGEADEDRQSLTVPDVTETGEIRDK